MPHPRLLQFGFGALGFDLSVQKRCHSEPQPISPAHKAQRLYPHLVVMAHETPLIHMVVLLALSLPRGARLFARALLVVSEMGELVTLMDQNTAWRVSAHLVH